MKERHNKLQSLDFGVSLGVVVGGIVFIITMFSLMNLMGGFVLTTNIFADLYGTIGYSVSPIGAVLGAIYAFIDTFILAFIFAWIYNKLLNISN